MRGFSALSTAYIMLIPKKGTPSSPKISDRRQIHCRPPPVAPLLLPPPTPSCPEDAQRHRLPQRLEDERRGLDPPPPSAPSCSLMRRWPDSSGALHDRVELPRESHPVVLPVSSLRTSSSLARKVEKVKDEVEEPGMAVVAVAAASRSFRQRRLQKSLEEEQVAARWLPWLSAVASEAIQGVDPAQGRLWSFQLCD